MTEIVVPIKNVVNKFDVFAYFTVKIITVICGQCFLS